MQLAKKLLHLNDVHILNAGSLEDIKIMLNTLLNYGTRFVALFGAINTLSVKCFHDPQVATE